VGKGVGLEVGAGVGVGVEELDELKLQSNRSPKPFELMHVPLVTFRLAE
jgi:hypothetical protein